MGHFVSSDTSRMHYKLHSLGVTFSIKVFELYRNYCYMCQSQGHIVVQFTVDQLTYKLAPVVGLLLVKETLAQCSVRRYRERWSR